MSPVATACKTVDEAIAAHKAGKIDDAEYKEVLAKLFGNGNGREVTMKVSEKGACTFRGVPGTSGKFGMTLYPETLEWLYANQKRVEQFIKDNDSKLSRKKRS